MNERDDYLATVGNEVRGLHAHTTRMMTQAEELCADQEIEQILGLTSADQSLQERVAELKHADPPNWERSKRAVEAALGELREQIRAIQVQLDRLRSAYTRKASAEFHQLGSEINDMDARLGRTSPGARLDEDRRRLHERREQVQQWLDRMESAPETAWPDAKLCFEQAWRELQTDWQNVAPRLRTMSAVRLGIPPTTLIAHNWWAFALRGFMAILFGALLLARPTTGLLVLILLFGAFSLVDGILALVGAVNAGARQERWVALAISGVLGVTAGVLSVLWPGLTALALLWIIALWAIATGTMELVSAIRLRRVIHGEWLLALHGILSIVFGCLLVLRPAAGLLTLVILTGGYAIAAGVVIFGLALRLRGRFVQVPSPA